MMEKKNYDKQGGCWVMIWVKRSHELMHIMSSGWSHSSSKKKKESENNYCSKWLVKWDPNAVLCVTFLSICGCVEACEADRVKRVRRIQMSCMKDPLASVLAFESTI